MLIHITSRCNMTCQHCCYSCTSDGIDMQRSIFIAACELALKLNDPLVEISGGEPTLHPLLWDFIGLAIRLQKDNRIVVITNGKRTDDALALARLGKHQVICADLSLDRFHDPIDYSVIEAFDTKKTTIRIRDVTNNDMIEPAPFGKASIWATDRDMRCPGNDLLIASDGIIFACGCKTVTYGTVFDPELPDPLPTDQWCPDKLGWYRKRKEVA